MIFKSSLFNRIPIGRKFHNQLVLHSANFSVLLLWEPWTKIEWNRKRYVHFCCFNSVHLVCILLLFLLVWTHFLWWISKSRKLAIWWMVSISTDLLFVKPTMVLWFWTNLVTITMHRIQNDIQPFFSYHMDNILFYVFYIEHTLTTVRTFVSHFTQVRVCLLTIILVKDILQSSKMR